MIIRILALLSAGLGLCGSLAAQTYTFTTASTAAYSPAGVAIDPSGAIFVSGSYSNTVYKLSPAGSVLAQYGGNSSGSADGTGSSARFYSPRGLALDAAGNVYVADTNNHTVRKITPAGVVSTVAGSPGNAGNADGAGSAARFHYPQGIAIDSGGNLYVIDTSNHTLRKITPEGVVSTFVGAAGLAGRDDGIGSAARFNFPQGIAVDSAGNLFVADTLNSTIRKITSAGVVTTFAGSALNFGTADGPAALARFYTPFGLAVDAAGNVFVADTNNQTIRKISAGVVTTIGGLAANSGEVAGVGAAARFYGPRAIALDASGNLFIATSGYLRLGTSSSQLAITVQPQNLTVGSGSSAIFSITATGATPITYQWQKNGTAIAGATSSTLTISAVQSADAATYTVTVANSIATLASAGATLTVLAPVPNDNFASAQVITGSTGSVSGSNNGATGEPGEPTHGSPAATASSIWYKWTPAETGTAVFSISAGFATSQAGWSGSSLNSLTREAVGSGSRITLKVSAGTTYYLAVGSNSVGSRGNLTATWRIIPNDDFANAQLITGDSGSVTANNDGATGEPGEPMHVASSGTNTSIWYRWVPAQGGIAVFDTAGSSLDTVLAAYTGTSITGLVFRASDYRSNDATTTAGRSRIAFPVNAGAAYFIAVGSGSYGTGGITLNWRITQTPVITRQPTLFSPQGSPQSSTTSISVPVGASVTFLNFQLIGDSIQWRRDGVAIPNGTSPPLVLNNVQTSDAGTYTAVVTNSAGSITSSALTLIVLQPPANDSFATAITLSGLTGQFSGTNVNATGEAGEPAHWNLFGTAASVWYKWTPSASGLAAIDTVGSGFDTVLAVYTGSSLATLTRLAQDDDRGGGRTSLVNFAATAGTTYYIAVGGATGNARGNLTLNWQLTPVVAITTQPVGQAVAVGGSATFSVTAAGSGVTYQWHRNGVAIPGATNSTLTIGSVQGGADASYTVTVTSSVGSVTSAPATLTVTAPLLTTLSMRHTRAGGGMLWSIAAGSGTLVAVGDGGAILSSLDNGRTWTPRVSGNTAWLVAVTYGGGQFVVVGAEGRILTSPDGITWTPAPAPATKERLNNVLYADEKYVAIGEHGTVVTSLDARTWTLRTTPASTWLHGLAWHAGIRHFATAGEGGVLLTSPDAITWTRLPIPGFTGELHHIVAVDSYAHFVVAGGQGKVISVRQNQLVLKDGQSLTTWTAEALSTNTSAVLIGLVQGAGALFATTDDGQVITAANDRGPWHSLPSGTDGFLTAGTYHSNRLYIVGREETVIESGPIYSTRLVNISTRGEVGTGGEVMISGFIVEGTTPKRMLVRAAGPALAGFGVSGTLAAPVLTLFNGAGQPIAVNAGWGNAANSGAIAAAASATGGFPFATGSADSAILTTLDPGHYTAQISGANNTTGVAIVEAYDLEPLSVETSRAINVSTRGLVGGGQGKMIAGFVIDGSSARRVLIRAIGPALAGFGVPGTLAEPQLELYTSRGLLQATAGAWGLQPNADEIRGAAQSISAFALADGSKDATMLTTLLPGAWTVQVGGPTGTSGVALVEVYVLP